MQSAVCIKRIYEAMFNEDGLAIKPEELLQS